MNEIFFSLPAQSKNAAAYRAWLKCVLVKVDLDTGYGKRWLSLKVLRTKQAEYGVFTNDGGEHEHAPFKC